MELDNYSELRDFRGRRNTVLTITLPEEKRIDRLFESIERPIKSMKNTHMRKQIFTVIKLFRRDLKDTILVPESGLLLCGGLASDGTPFHRIIKPKSPVPEYAYYYGDCFNLLFLLQYLLPKELFHLADEEETKEWIELIPRLLKEEKLAVGDQLPEMIETRRLKQFLILDSSPIDQALLEKLGEGKTQLVVLQDNIHLRDLAKDLGEHLGTLRY